MWVRGLKQRMTNYVQKDSMSHPMWVRGLKLVHHIILVMKVRVAPYVGAWIET